MGESEGSIVGTRARGESTAAALTRVGWEAESSVAARVMERMAVSGAVRRAVRRAAGRSREWIAAGSAAAARSGFFRARSHCASRACTSASTHSSKISCSSLRRLATALRRLRRKDSIEASDEVKRYSRGRSMASSRDPEFCFASSLERGIADKDIIHVITV